MEDKFQYQLNDVKDAEARFNLAQKQRQEMNEEHRGKLTDYYDKLAIYCASAISFTVTLLGFLFTNKDILGIYKSQFLGYPMIYLIYIAWISLAVALASSLLSRKMDAFYVSYFGHALYLEKGADFESKRIDMIKNNPGLELVDIKVDELPGWISEKEELLKKMPKALEKAKLQRNLYFFLLRSLRNLSEAGAFIGTGLLIIFSILSAQRMLFGA